PLPVSGSRTWMWTIAAPALAASIADSAICVGVTGTSSLLLVVSPTPVTAQVTNTSQFTVRTLPHARVAAAEHPARGRRPARRARAARVRQPGRACAEPRAPRRRGTRIRARTVRVAALRPLPRVADDGPAPLAHGRGRQRRRAAGVGADV